MAEGYTTPEYKNKNESPSIVKAFGEAYSSATNFGKDLVKNVKNLTKNMNVSPEETGSIPGLNPETSGLSGGKKRKTKRRRRKSTVNKRRKTIRRKTSKRKTKNKKRRRK